MKTLSNKSDMMFFCEYAGNDKVYVPVENIDKLYKYTSNLGTHPKLNKLNRYLKIVDNSFEHSSKSNLCFSISDIPT